MASDFSLPHNLQTGSVTNPVSYPVDAGCCSPGAKGLGSVSGPSSPSLAEVKNGGTAPQVFMAWCSVTNLAFMTHNDTSVP
jgi:hypothetical protein